MIKQMAWNTFKKTGSIDSYLELAKLKNFENDILKTEILDNNETKKEKNK